MSYRKFNQIWAVSLYCRCVMVSCDGNKASPVPRWFIQIGLGSGFPPILATGFGLYGKAYISLSPPLIQSVASAEPS